MRQNVQVPCRALRPRAEPDARGARSGIENSDFGRNDREEGSEVAGDERHTWPP